MIYFLSLYNDVQNKSIYHSKITKVIIIIIIFWYLIYHYDKKKK